MLNKVAEDEYNRSSAGQAQQMIKEQEKQKQKAAPLEGNLALKFLMNPKELGQLVNFKEKQRKSSLTETVKQQQIQRKDTKKDSPPFESADRNATIDMGSTMGSINNSMG
jgi:hypothetical protein